MNLDPLVDALTPPQVTIQGRTYVGRLLSFEQWAPFAPLFEQMAQGQLESHETMALLRLYLRKVFPWRPWYWWQRDPVRQILTQPLSIQLEALADFLGCQGRATTGTRPSPTPSAMIPSDGARPT